MRKSMKPVKIANSSNGIAEAFSHLAELPFVEYQENASQENAFKLHHNEVDVALIPLTEFACHGDYVGLDFGISCMASFGKLILHVEGSLSQLQTIYLHPLASTGAVLLRLLLLEHWQVSPRLVRLSESVAPEELGQNEGTLLLYQSEFDVASAAPGQAIDLIKEWYRWTGLPMVLNLWATRASALNVHRARELCAALYRCSSVFEANQITPAGNDSTVECTSRLSQDCSPGFQLYLSEESKRGLQRFLDMASAKGLLPEARYGNLQLPISGQASAFITKKSCESILESALEGKRLSLTDAIYLGENAQLGDLGVVADMLRRRLYSESSCKFVLGIEDEALDDSDELLAKVEAAGKEGVTQLLLFPDPEGAMRKLCFYEQRLNQLRSAGSFHIEGFGAQQLLSIAALEGLRVREVAERLVKAGLDIVPSWGGEMLSDDSVSDTEWRLPRNQWLRAIRWVHRYGARSSCSLNANRKASWTYIVSHLNVLRQLQDLTGGFCYFCNYESDAIADTVGVERRLRCAAIARLFLDNIPAVHEVRVRSSSFVAPASLCFGSNAAYILRSQATTEPISALAATMKAVSDTGIPFSSESVSRLGIVTHA